MNLPESISSDEVLRNQRFLGQYGKIEKIILHKNGTAHVTFTSVNSAQLCIKSLDNFHYCGTRISALVGTTKYPEDVDLNRIMANSINELPVAPCPNPVFPSPLLLSPRANIGPHDHMITMGPHPTASTEDGIDEVEIETAALEGLVFGTGGMVHSMWVTGSDNSEVVRNETEYSSASRRPSASAFVPKPVMDMDDNTLKTLAEVDSWEMNSVSDVSIATKQVEDFWSSSSGSEDGDDLDGSLLDDCLSVDVSGGLSIDISDAQSDSNSEWGLESTEESNAPTLSGQPIEHQTAPIPSAAPMPFSPCKEMIRALTAHVWKPSSKREVDAPRKPSPPPYNVSYIRSSEQSFTGALSMANTYCAPVSRMYPHPYIHMPMSPMTHYPMQFHGHPHILNHQYAHNMGLGVGPCSM